VNRISVFPILIPVFVLLAIASTNPALGAATEYGRSVEDLIGVFSIEKTIQIGGSSQDFLSASDPLSPPRSLAFGPMSDDQAFYGAEARFTGPDGVVAVALFQAANITAGSAKDGWYNASIILPDNQTGEWRLESLTIVDQQGNRRVMAGRELEDRGFPVGISVIQPIALFS
jgi:hypothetical protein